MPDGGTVVAGRGAIGLGREAQRVSGAVMIGSLGDAEPSVHPEAWVAPGALVVGAVRIGPRASVWYGSVLRADEDEIVVGAECNIQDLCCLHADPGEPAVLEARVTVGHHATVHGAYVETGALIGIGAVVLGGARIGSRSLVAAGTVVLAGTTVPPGVLFGGVPGRVIKDLSGQDYERLDRTPDRYVHRAARHRDARWVTGHG
jgi:carbonic anhydrase/acetyltransferase-like protein (isoleucine patch superfamily)